MAILIPRNAQEVNQHQHQNGLEWSRNEQNRLAGSLEASQARANLRNEIGVFQVERGDTLGAIAKGLMGTINWSQRVDYRSNRVASNKPTQLSEANLIYPGQYVWVENNVIVVADALPVNTAPPARPQTVPQPAPTTPVNPRVIPPLPAPAVVPRVSNWRPSVSVPQSRPFIALPLKTQLILRREFPLAITANVENSSLETNNLPSNIDAMVSIAERCINVPDQVPFLISRDIDIGSQGAHYNLPGGYIARPYFFGNPVTSITPFPSTTVMLLNLSGEENSIYPPRIDSADFAGTLLNEFSHSVTTQLFDEYLARRTQQLIGQPMSELVSVEEMKAEMIAGFNHPYVPRGLYNFQSYNELQSDTFSMSVFPERILGRYLVYGETPLNPPSYDLNRDFTALHLSEFLRSNGYGNHSMDEIKQMFRRLYSAHNTSNNAEVQRLFTDYHLDDPDFFAFIQPRYQAVGEAFYTHLTNKINAL